LSCPLKPKNPKYAIRNHLQNSGIQPESLHASACEDEWCLY